MVAGFHTGFFSRGTSITAHYISQHYNLQSCHFPGSHTALNIATMLQKLVEEECGVDLHMQVPAFPTDNAKNVVNAVSENLTLVAIPCAGHSFNPAVQDENCFGKIQEVC